MKSTRHWSFLIRVATGAIGFLVGAASATAQTYQIRELPAPDPSRESWGAGINESGDVAGFALVSGSIVHAIKWEQGIPVDLDVLPGSVNSLAGAISDDSWVVGHSLNWNECGEGTSPTLWDGTYTEALPRPPRLAVYAYQIKYVGFATKAIVGEALDSCAPPWNDMAYVWESRWGTPWGFWPLPPLPGDPESGAYDISGIGFDYGGRAVGFSGNSGGPNPRLRACGWQYQDPGGSPVPLPDLGGNHSIAHGINDLEQFVGYSRTPEGLFRAYSWDGDSTIDLGTLPGWPHSAATRLNNAGTVIGYAFSEAGDQFWPYWIASWQRGFVWRHGVLHDINDLIPSGSGWVVGGLRDINEGGQIVGNGWLNGRRRACLLTPAYGDLNCDGNVDAFDIEPFLMALFDPSGYVAIYPNCDLLNGDINRDANVDAFDIEPFLELLFGP